MRAIHIFNPYFTQLENIITKTLKLFQQHTKKFNLDDITRRDDNKTWSYRKLIIGPTGSGKNLTFNSTR